MNPKIKFTLRILSIFTTIIWMVVIFRFSQDTGVTSHELSDRCVEIFNKAVYYFTGKDLRIAISPSNYDLIEQFFRKMAHMFIYFVLSINIMVVLFTFNLHMVIRMFLSLLFCFLYALTDEYHQLHVEGRGASFWDCMIDTTGALLGVFAALILYCILYTIMIKYQKSTGKLRIVKKKPI